MNVLEKIACLRDEQRTIEAKYPNFRMGVSNAVFGLPKEYTRFKEIDTEIQTLKTTEIIKLTDKLNALATKYPKFVSFITAKKRNEILSQIKAIRMS